MKYIYEAIVVKSGDCFEASFPQLDLVTQGEDFCDAAFMAQDLLENHIVLALQRGGELPAPKFMQECLDGAYRMGIVVECSASTPAAETMSVAQAADLLDVSPARIRAMIRDGILSSEKVGAVHMVDAESVMLRFNEPVGAGRPKKEAAIA